MTKTRAEWATDLENCPGGTTLDPGECEQLAALLRDTKPQRYNVGADGCAWEDDRGTYVRYEDVAQLLGDDSA